MAGLQELDSIKFILIERSKNKNLFLISPKQFKLTFNTLYCTNEFYRTILI